MNMKTVRIINPSLSPKKPWGAGDYAASVAKPMAALIDKVFSTDLSNCKSCEERRQRWNEKFRLSKNQPT